MTARACYELHAPGAAGSAQRQVRRMDPTLWPLPASGGGKSLPFPCVRGKGAGGIGVESAYHAPGHCAAAGMAFLTVLSYFIHENLRCAVYDNA